MSREKLKAMIETFFILAMCTVPCAVYVTLGVFMIIRYRRTENRTDIPALYARRDFAVFLFAAAACFVSGAATRIWAPDSDLYLTVDLTVLKLYLVSAAVPCLLLRRMAFPDRPWVQFYVFAALAAALFLFSDVLISLGYGSLSRSILCRGAVTVNLVVFLVCLRYAAVFSNREDGNLRALGRELQTNMMALSLYNFLFLLYSFHLHVIMDYFLLVTGFAVIHATMAVYISQGKAVLTDVMPSPVCTVPAARGRDSMCVSGEENRDDGQGTVQDDTAASLKDRLLGYFEYEKPYLSKNLTMEEVAMRLFTNKTYLSKTINVEMNKNFRELVNYFRVKEAIRIFHEDSSLSMSELRERCGFNNNASFTSAFKLNTGYTPGEWCRDMKNRMGKSDSTGE